MLLRRIVSGGQSGVDVAALRAAQKKGIPTGGVMPQGYRTLDGPKPEYAELYNVTQHAASSYPPRTFQNVKDSDGTLRIASKMESAGEKCTLKAIEQYSRPHFDVYVKDPAHCVLPESAHPKTAALWIVRNKISVLNVAGNSEHTCYGIGAFAERYIVSMITELESL